MGYGATRSVCGVRSWHTMVLRAGCAVSGTAILYSTMALWYYGTEAVRARYRVRGEWRNESEVQEAMAALEARGRGPPPTLCILAVPRQSMLLHIMRYWYRICGYGTRGTETGYAACRRVEADGMGSRQGICIGPVDDQYSHRFTKKLYDGGC
eukprot:1918006-Rhodomonas_salina.1